MTKRGYISSPKWITFHLICPKDMTCMQECSFKIYQMKIYNLYLFLLKHVLNKACSRKLCLSHGSAPEFIKQGENYLYI